MRTRRINFERSFTNRVVVFINFLEDKSNVNRKIVGTSVFWYTEVLRDHSIMFRNSDLWV